MTDLPAMPPLADWQDRASYNYTHELTRDAWAWEFLRRNQAYRATWDDIRRGRRRARDQATEISQRFGVLSSEDPQRTALDAKLLWREEASSFVLPLHAESGSGTDESLIVDLSSLRKRAARSASQGTTQHVLFAEHGRRLQLAIEGADLFGRVRLLTRAPLDPTTFKRQMALLHQLAELRVHNRLPRRLYPPDPRGRRLAVVLRVLDGWLAKTSQRTIGEAVFNADGGERDWRDCQCPLRERLRLTLQRGRWLMEGGYLTLLQ